MIGVVGIDPSLSATGIAATDGALTVVGGDAKAGDSRLCKIADAVAQVVEEADVVVLELLPQHLKAAGITGMVQGVIRMTLINAGVPYLCLPPATVKKYATGNGQADKSDMRMALYQRAGIDERNDNKVDAWWLRAAGLDHYGHPVVTVPKAQREALTKATWPNLAGLAA